MRPKLGLLTWWGRRTRSERLVTGLAVGFVVFRVVLATSSSFGFHQGWNEGHYALLGRGFRRHPLVPRYGDRVVYNVPPLFSYLVALSFTLFGESAVAARLPSVVAGGVTILATFDLARTRRDERTAALAAVVVATLPYVMLYAGRAQTDVLMTALFTVSLAAIVRGYEAESEPWRALAFGGVVFAAAVAAKQPALILPGVVLAWLVSQRRFDADTVRRTGWLIFVSGLALLPLFVWLYLNFRAEPAAFLADWRQELFGRTAAFANLPLLIAIGFGLGMTPPVLGLAGVGAVGEFRRRALSPVTWWLFLYGAFVFARTPHGHQYYAVALAPPIAIHAAVGVRRVVRLAAGRVGADGGAIRLVVVALLLLSTIGGSFALFELSGELSVAEGGGSHVASDAGAFVGESVPENATVLVPNGFEPPIKWYARDEFDIRRIQAYGVASLTDRRIERAVDDAEGPVYLVVPAPSWGPTPGVETTRVHTTDPYQFTVFSVVGRFFETDSKFTYYLNDRRLVVYRVESVADGEETNRVDREPRPTGGTHGSPAGFRNWDTVTRRHTVAVTGGVAVHS